MIEYRKAALGDMDELVRLRIEFLKEAQNIESDSNDADVRKALENYLDGAMKNNAFIAWVAVDDNRIVATSGLCFLTVPPTYKNPEGTVAYIMNMYTRPDYRNRGIANGLFEKTLDEAKNLGYRHFSLHATEKGRPLYARHGFTSSGDEMVFKLE